MSEKSVTDGRIGAVMRDKCEVAGDRKGGAFGVRFREG